MGPHKIPYQSKSDNSTCLQRKRVTRNRLTLDGWCLKLPRHVVRKDRKEREYNEIWEEFRKENAKNFQVCDGRVQICERLELELELKMLKKIFIFNDG